jgi:hypothetical protein
MLIRKRYRASFNFLEHPRVVIALKRKVGPVRDISFSTRRPDDVLRLIQEVISANSADWSNSVGPVRHTWAIGESSLASSLISCNVAVACYLYAMSQITCIR